MPREHQWRVALLTIDRIGLLRVERLEALGRLAVHALVQFGVRVAQLNRNVPQFLSE